MMLRMSIIYLIGRYGASAVTLIAISLYTRFATPAEYGLYALVIALATALYSGLGQWLKHVLLRFAIHEKQGTDPIPSAVLQIFLGLCTVFAFIAVSAQFLYSSEKALILKLALPLLFAMGVFELALAWLQLQLRSSFYVALSFLRTFSASILGLLALWLGYGATGLVIATCFAYIIGAIPAFFSTRFGLGRAHIGTAETKSILSYGLPLAVSAALGSALAFADRAIIASLISTEAAGLYAAPYDLANRTLQVLMLAINLAGTPLILRAYEAGTTERCEQLLSRQWLFLLIAASPVTLVMMLMPNAIASVLLGHHFQTDGAILMPYVALATFFQGLESFYFSLAFTLAKRPLRQMVVLFLATIMNIGLTLYWVPDHGIVGGAWATLASAAFALFVSATIGRYVLPIPIQPMMLLKVITTSAVMFLYLLWRKPIGIGPSLFDGTIGFILYLAMLISFNIGNIRIELRQRFFQRTALAASTEAHSIKE